MKSILLSTVATLAFISAASAADLAYPRPVPAAPVYTATPIFTWTGVYVGVNGGYGFGKQTDQWGDSLKTNGGTIGGTVGYNWQMPNNVVLGVEADLNWADFKGSNTTNYYCGCSLTPYGSDKVTGKVDSYGTARARLGYAFGPVLPYITGGLYWQHTKANDLYTYNYGRSSSNYSASNSATGWVLGAGVEYALTSNWSVKGEYLYARVNDNSFRFDGFDYHFKSRQQIVRAGLNYRF